MILIDYTQLAISGIMQFQDDLKRGTKEKSEGLIRHVIINSLLSNKKKFSAEYGKLVICTDSRNYWRRAVFPYYKASRTKSRAESGLDWKFIFDTISAIRQELKENFPYQVLEVDRAEADDIIGVLCKYAQTNELVENDPKIEPQKILILSSDNDNLQLHRYHGVKQWNSMMKKFVKPEVSAHRSLIDKICMGDAGDGIPNIMSVDDVFVQENMRQKPFRKQRLSEFYEHGINACKTDEERRNYQRNELLVSYDSIPEDLAQSIIDIYKTTTAVKSKMQIMSYFAQHRMKQLMENIEDF